MRNPFAKAHSPGQWLLGSLCWTMVCLISWLAIGAAVLEKPYDQKTPDEPWFFVSFAVMHGLLWWRAVPGLRATETDASSLEMLAFVWLVGLIAFQLISLAVMLLTLASVIFYEPVNWN